MTLNSSQSCISDGFISHVEIWQLIPDSAAVCVDFCLEYFHQNLFCRYAIEAADTLQGSVNKRRAEYLAGRFCAQRALMHHADISARKAQVGVGPDRAPIWPDNVIGSISHTDNKALCVVVSLSKYEFIGVDIETIISDKQVQDLASHIYSDAELQLLTARGKSPEYASTLIFSAKESIFKALHRFVGTYFGFEVACLVAVDSVNQRLKFKLDSSFCLQYNAPSEVVCHYKNFDGLILTYTANARNH